MPSNSPPLWLRISDDEERITVRFAPGTSLTEANTEDFGREVEHLLEQRERPTLCIDLTGVAMLTSVALAKLVTLNEKAHKAGGRLTINNPTPAIHQVFKITRLDTILDISLLPV